MSGMTKDGAKCRPKEGKNMKVWTAVWSKNVKDRKWDFKTHFDKILPWFFNSLPSVRYFHANNKTTVFYFFQVTRINSLTLSVKNFAFFFRGTKKVRMKNVHKCWNKNKYWIVSLCLQNIREFWSKLKCVTKSNFYSNLLFMSIGYKLKTSVLV